jgi:hypothetical protein
MTTTTKTAATLKHGDLFGEFSRYQLVWHESHRGEEFSMWLVLDAERPDELTGMPGIIRQAATVADAVEGLL